MKTLIASVCVLVACSSSPLTPVPASDGDIAGNAAAAGASSGSVLFVDGCSAARVQLLGAIETVSTGAVQELANASGVKTLYVDATAGGQDGVTTHPWTFVALGDAAKAAVDDVTSLQSLAWDLAFKRAEIYTNGGEGRSGHGASAYVDKDFANVTSADLTAADFASEKFFDDDL